MRRTVVGELVQAWPEHLDHSDAAANGGDGLLSWIQPEDGDAVRVRTEDVEHIGRGATVEADLGREVEDAAADAGLEPAREVLSAEVVETAPADPPVAEALPTAWLTNRVTVMMVVPAGGARDATTLADVVTAVNDPVGDFWSRETNAAVWVGVDSQFDWPASPYTASCADPEALWDEAQTKSGFVPGPGKHLFLYVPSGSPGCFDGLAEFGDAPSTGGRLYVTAALPSLIAHELGHNFGLRHSSALQCDSSVETGSCQIASYADFYDVMGASWEEMGALSPPQAAALGFMGGTRYYGQRFDVQADSRVQDYDLYPWGSNSPGCYCAGAVRMVGADDVVYWMEFRGAAGQDAWLGDSSRNSGLQTGVLVRMEADPDWGDDGSYLLDGTPSAAADWNGDSDVALPTGHTFYLAGGSLQVTVTSQDSSMARVHVVSAAPMGGDVGCLDRPSTPASGVALASVRGGIYAFGTGTDRQVWYRPVARNAPGWQSLGGVSLYGPAAVTSGTTAFVFVIGGDHQLYMRADSGYGWGPWTSLGGYLTGTPAIASLGEEHLRIFGRGADNELWTREYNRGWAGWTYLGGILTSPPTATAYPAYGQVEVSVRGANGLVYTMGLGRGQGYRGYLERPFAGCSTLAVPSVSTSAFYSGRVYLDSGGGLWAGSADPVRPHYYGGRFLSNPDIESSGWASMIAGTGGDRQLWVYDSRPGGVGGWVSWGGQLL